MEYINRLSCEFEARSSNEGLARTIVASLALSLDPTLDELDDLRTAVSEAVQTVLSMDIIRNVVLKT